MAMRLDNVAAVLFDLDETLIHNALSFEALCNDAYDRFADKLAAAPRQAFWETFWSKAVDMWTMMLEGALDGRQAHRYTFINTLRALELDEALAEPLAECLDQRQAESSCLIDGADYVLARLRKGGMRLAIVTNGYAATQRRKLAHHRLVEQVDAVVISSEAGVHKPNKAIFDLALSAIGVPASQSVFVGDMPDADMAGARNAGMRGVLMDPNGLWQDFEGLPAQSQELARHRIRRPVDLLDLLGLAEDDS